MDNVLILRDLYAYGSIVKRINLDAVYFTFVQSRRRIAKLYLTMIVQFIILKY